MKELVQGRHPTGKFESLRRVLLNLLSVNRSSVAAYMSALIIIDPRRVANYCVRFKVEAIYGESSGKGFRNWNYLLQTP